MARSKALLPIMLLALLGSAVLALSLGRYPLNLCACAKALADALAGASLGEGARREIFLLVDIRLPRVVAAMLVGASLAVSGALYQNLFQNPLVSPGILGVQHGAAFGGALGIVLFSSIPAAQVFSFSGGLAGVGLAVFFSWLYPRNRILALIIGGILSSSFFGALTSLMQYLANPDHQLPEIVYWLMGTLSRVEGDKLLWAAPPMLAGILFLCLSGKTVNALSMGDDEAKSLGVDTARARCWLIGTATFVSAMTVVLAGVVNWVGLVIPHVVRFLVGPDNRQGLAATALAGATFVLLTDTAVRSIWTVELPLGIATAIIALPIFAFSLWNGRRRPC